MNEDIEMTNEQSKTIELQARIDELDRMMEYTTDEKMLDMINERKKELRHRLDTL